MKAELDFTLQILTSKKVGCINQIHVVKYHDVATIQQLILRRGLCNIKHECLLNIFSFSDWMYILRCKICGHMKIDQLCSHNIEPY